MRKIVVVAGMLCLATAAMAADKYGTAGCGLGSMVFGNQKGGIQIVAATLNGTGVQTFGITTGTSNCNDTSGSSASIKSFVETNQLALAKDISRGQGETVANLSSLAGCSDSHAVAATLQKKFNSIFPSVATPADQAAQAILSTLKGDKMLVCTKLG
jgi:hypothetical protein